MSLVFSRHLSESLILPSLPAIMISLSAPQNMTRLMVTAFIVGMIVEKFIVTFLGDYLQLRRMALTLRPFLLAWIGPMPDTGNRTPFARSPVSGRWCLQRIGTAHHVPEIFRLWHTSH